MSSSTLAVYAGIFFSWTWPMCDATGRCVQGRGVACLIACKKASNNFVYFPKGVH
jgi:hypothetical protein